MEILNLKQGTKEWHEHRAKHFNASDAPAMMGESSYKTRTQLLDELKTGITPEVDAATQRRFDDGHRAEALARVHMEKKRGIALYPITAKDGKYSASSDGLTIDEVLGYEHKALNDRIRACETVDDLPAEYKIQMEHQMLVLPCKKIIFHATKWDGQELVEEIEFEYESNAKLKKQVIAGWEQFEKDLEAHVPTVKVEKVVASDVKQLPVPVVVTSGEVTTSNLDEITPIFDEYLDGINTTLETDQDFADAEANAKNCREAAKGIQTLRASIVAQMVSVSEADSTLSNYEDAFNKFGLMLEKAVKQEKEQRKREIVQKAADAFIRTVKLLEDEIKPISLNVSNPPFAEATKNKRSLASMQEAVEKVLRDAILDANDLARGIREQLAWYNEHAKGHEALFADLQTIIYKAQDDFELLVKSRIDEQVKKEAERAKPKPKPVNEARPAHVPNQAPPQLDEVESSFAQMPEPDAIVTAISHDFDVDYQIALEWLINTDFVALKKAA